MKFLNILILLTTFIFSGTFSANPAIAAKKAVKKTVKKKKKTPTKKAKKSSSKKIKGKTKKKAKVSAKKVEKNKAPQRILLVHGLEREEFNLLKNNFESLALDPSRIYVAKKTLDEEEFVKISRCPGLEETKCIKEFSKNNLLDHIFILLKNKQGLVVYDHGINPYKQKKIGVSKKFTAIPAEWKGSSKYNSLKIHGSIGVPIVINHIMIGTTPLKIRGFLSTDEEVEVNYRAGAAWSKKSILINKGENKLDLVEAITKEARIKAAPLKTSDNLYPFMTNVHPIALDKSKPLHKETWFWPSVGAGAVFIIGAMVLFSKKDLGDPKQNEPTGSFTIEF